MLDLRCSSPHLSVYYLCNLDWDRQYYIQTQLLQSRLLINCHNNFFPLISMLNAIRLWIRLPFCSLENWAWGRFLKARKVFNINFHCQGTNMANLLVISYINRQKVYFLRYPNIQIFEKYLGDLRLPLLNSTAIQTSLLANSLPSRPAESPYFCSVSYLFC